MIAMIGIAALCSLKFWLQGGFEHAPKTRRDCSCNHWYNLFLPTYRQVFEKKVAKKPKLEETTSNTVSVLI